jgi:excisionase family DNA binding protein
MGTSAPDDIVAKLKALRGLIGARTVAELLGLKPATVYKMARLNQVPCFRVGYSIRFDPSAIASWLQTRQIGKNEFGCAPALSGK